MSIITALNWRYATKRMTGVKIPAIKLDIILDAISLAPSSYGLQPYSILIIENREILEKIKPIALNQPQITEASALFVFTVWDKITSERINIFINQIARERNLTIDSLKPFQSQMESLLKNNDKDNIEWSAKQVYLALGIGLLAAAEEKIDSTLMEGFNRQQLDEFLRLKEKGLRSFVLMALGYRDIQNDYLVNLNKVRREKRKFFMKFQ